MLKIKNLEIIPQKCIKKHSFEGVISKNFEIIPQKLIFWLTDSLVKNIMKVVYMSGLKKEREHIMVSFKEGIS